MDNKVNITNLHNFTMPLIRFQMNDVLVPIKNYTPSPFVRVECGVGRPEGIAYLTTEKDGQVSVQPIEVDPLMPVGVKSFAMQGSKANHFYCTIFIDEKYVDQSESIRLQTEKSIQDFFSQKGLKDIQVEVHFGQDYKINPFSLKTQLWQKSTTHQI